MFWLKGTSGAQNRVSFNQVAYCFVQSSRISPRIPEQGEICIPQELHSYYNSYNSYYLSHDAIICLVHFTQDLKVTSAGAAIDLHILDISLSPQNPG